MVNSHHQLFHSVTPQYSIRRNITLRNTSISKRNTLSWVPEAWEESKWIPGDHKKIVPRKVVKLQRTLRENTRLTVFIWRRAEKTRTLLALSAVQRPSLIYALSVNKLRSLVLTSIMDTLLVLGSIISSCTEPCFLFPAPFISLTCVFIGLLRSTFLKIFSCSCSFHKLGMSSHTRQRSQWPWRLSCSYQYQQHSSIFCQNTSLQKDFP